MYRKPQWRDVFAVQLVLFPWWLAQRTYFHASWIYKHR
jgi:hypothetical protein